MKCINGATTTQRHVLFHILFPFFLIHDVSPHGIHSYWSQLDRVCRLYSEEQTGFFFQRREDRCVRRSVSLRFNCLRVNVKNRCRNVSTSRQRWVWAGVIRIWGCLLWLKALLDEVELIAQGLVAICHTDLGHIGLADVVALWTLLQEVMTQEVALLLEHKRKPQACFGASIKSSSCGTCLISLI